VDYGTVVAEVVEVALENGTVRVERVTAAVDPGLVINPSGVEAQAISAVNMGLSAALYEEVTVQDGALRPANFDAYPLLRNADAPDILVETIQSGEKPYGVGEPPIGPIGAALANAIAAAGGPRPRQMPFQL
jgi:isoquinoline 1-oxidoreductase beta subunit